MPDHKSSPPPVFDPTVLADYPQEITQAATAFSRSHSRDDLFTTLHALLRFHQVNSTDSAPPLNPASAPKETPLLAGLGLDSLGFAELSFLLTDLWGIEIENEELARLVTLEDLEEFLLNRLGVPA